MDKHTVSLMQGLADLDISAALFGTPSWSLPYTSKVTPLIAKVKAARKPLAKRAAQLDPYDSETAVFFDGRHLIKLLEIGEFNPFSLRSITGWSTLYVGEDNKFYVYEPVFRPYGWSSTPASGAEVKFRLKRLRIKKMTFPWTVRAYELLIPWTIT